ncbi:unnamed protein product, partial [Sphacelaria rigidula]
MTGDGGSCKAKRRRETATDTGKVLFSIDGGAWDSHDDDEDGREGADNDREDYDLEQIKKCTWDAKFRACDASVMRRAQQVYTKEDSRHACSAMNGGNTHT